jgi:hypothetical protein
VFFQRGVDGAWVVAGSARVGFERRRALDLVASDQLLYPIAGDVVVPGHFALLRPSSTTAVMTSCAFDMADLPGVTRCQLCRETAANYVVKPDTVSPTTKRVSDLVV